MLKPKSNKLKSFIMGKGFYLVLALCVVGAGTAAWIAVDRTLGTLDGQDPADNLGSKEEIEWSFTSAADVGGITPNIPISSQSSASSQSGSSQSSVSSSSEGSSEQSESSDQQTLSLRPQEQAFTLPVSGEIFNHYSGGELVKNETLGEWRTHDGIDIKSELGAIVNACGAGTVTRVYQDTLWGWTVEISHENDITSICSGLDGAVLVAEGDKVLGGTQIGVIGDTNVAELSMDSHLHFAMKQNGKWIDPVATIGQ